MSFKAQLIIIIFASMVLIFVFELLRRKKMSEATTLWWLVIIISIILLTINQPFLIEINKLFGTAYPISALMLLGLSFILLMLIYFSMKISVLSNQLKDIAQYVSILKNEIDKIIKTDKQE